MRAVLTFELPEDKDQHTLAIKGSEFHSCLWDLDQACRDRMKHTELSDKEYEIYEWVREFILDEVDIYCVE